VVICAVRSQLVHEPFGPPAWKTIPPWAVIETGDQVIPPADLAFMAERDPAQRDASGVSRRSDTNHDNATATYSAQAIQGSAMPARCPLQRRPCMTVAMLGNFRSARPSV